MRQDTRKILLMLCAVSSKRTLLELWADLKEASKAEFEFEIKKAQAAVADVLDGGGGKPPSPRSRPAKRVPRDDRPVSRLLHHLTGTLGLSETEAARALRSALGEAGIDSAKIPSSERRSLTEWLEALLERVSGSVVMGAAQRIERR